MRAYNVATYRHLARRRIPRPVFDYLDGGADDEVTMRGNESGFAELRLSHRLHRDASPVDLTTTLCGQPMTMPVVLAPIGNLGLFHYSGDVGAAEVADKLGLVMVMSANGSYSIEEVAAASARAPWYQLYPWIDRGFFGDLIDRAATAGLGGLVVTVDTSVLGNRERDISNRFTPSAPGWFGVRDALGLIRRPLWSWGVVRHRRIAVRAFASQSTRPSLRRLVGEAKQSAAQVTRTMLRLTWDDVAWIRGRWRGPFAVKGIVDPGDARRAVDAGADVVFVSNHGGRQLDGAITAIEALPAIVEAIGDRAEVVLDGGVRRGTDVIKALCLGARAVSIGRPWVYGLAAGGPAGATGVIERLRRELAIGMNLLGEADVKRLDASWLAAAGVRIPWIEPEGPRAAHRHAQREHQLLPAAETRQ